MILSLNSSAQDIIIFFVNSLIFSFFCESNSCIFVVQVRLADRFVEGPPTVSEATHQYLYNNAYTYTLMLREPAWLTYSTLQYI